VVVVASVARNRSSLAIGNVIGSTISNILGAFSLGLLFHSAGQKIVFDRSSKIYSLLLLVLTLFVTLLTFLGTPGSWKIFGGILLALFVIYVASVAWAISRGAITAPELSDSDDSDDDNSSDSDSEVRPHLNAEVETESRAPKDAEAAPTAIPANLPLDASSARQDRTPRRRRRRSLKYHIAFLLIGFLSICLSGYVLSHAATTISDEIGISNVLFGVVILSIATTLPEKFIAVLSGFRGHSGILVANTVGSNIFLLSLCMGIVLVVTGGEFDAGSVNATELGVMMGSTVALTATVWFGAKWSRWIGGAMLLAYIAFLILEFTLIRKV
jgi:Ca2+/Na+ antiporter